MTFSSAGLIGAVVGFAMATGVYLAATVALKRGTPDPSKSAEEREKSASTLRMILLADIPILTAVGYFCGQALQ
jgi:hypothetical protein